MSHSREKQCDDFAFEIFGKQFNSLTQEMKWFVFLHVKEYEQYRDEIRQRLIGVFRLKGGAQFQIIREWYYKRIPLWMVLQSIDQCMNHLLRNTKPLLSLRYFEPEIYSRFYKKKKAEIPRSPHETQDEKWLWPAYQSWNQEKEKTATFDLFYGRIPG